MEHELEDVVEEIKTVLFLLVVRERVFAVTESVVASPILVFVVENGGADGGGEGVEGGGVGGVGLDVVFDLLIFSLMGLWLEMWRDLGHTSASMGAPRSSEGVASGGA